ncbi:hypothetical protein [Deinococcus ruber]|uniref:hypothetical protein n=1 Tax=Deinococcus ruber TaxID=1848197 RepID=UPI001668392B|nr:hypothetical protein [Deinococcus ruber]
MRSVLLSALVLATLAGSRAAAAPTQDTTPNPYIGGNITRTYSADDLKKTYGILDMAVGEIWVLNLPDTVTDVITSRDGVLQFSQRGNRVVMGAIASSGSYPVLVMTGDSVYFFQARLSASRGGGVRNVVVRGDESPNQDQQMPGFPATPATSEVAPPRSSSPVVRSVPTPALAVPVAAIQPAQASVSTPVTVAAPMRSAPAAVVSAPVSVPVSVPSAPVAAPSQAVDASVDFRALSNGQQTMLYYQVINHGSTPLTFDEASLTLRNAVGPVAYTPTRRDVTVAPGQAVQGQVLIPNAQTSFDALWTSVATDGQAQARVTRTVTVERVN